ncbi:MAG TPA: hypothetical protein VF762_08380 [Blastocatellia bacterium]|jgi:hypothetical protein
MLENLGLSSFSEHLNTKFRVLAGGDKVVELDLVEAKDLGSNARQERFSMLFRGPLDDALEQRTYKMEHDRLGSHELFIVPVGVSGDVREYEVIFNRLLR